MAYPAVLPANQPPERFYRGGAQITRFRGEGHVADHEPEDWVASTTTLAGEDRLGLSQLPDGRLLRDAVAQDPVGWLGAEHVGQFGEDTKILVKLLDAGQRLPVHAHPGTAFARRTLSRPHGKAEAWFILSPGEVHLGLRRPVDTDELRDLVARQDVDALLSLLHRRTVAAGDTVYVPPGTLHAIGASTFLVEVQEPEDLSILLEWRGFDLDGAADGHLGLGFDTALEAVDRRVLSEADVDALLTRGLLGDSVLAEASAGYFRLGHVAVSTSAANPRHLDPGFCVVVVTRGTLTLRSASGWVADVSHGQTLVLPHAVGAIDASGDGGLVVARPPRPGMPTP